MPCSAALEEKRWTGSAPAMSAAAAAESSSIGKNSDADDDDDGGENEVQGPLREGFMDSLEEALPIRRGISSFYDGKSKSFASLADASSYESMKAIVKPDTAYSRKRRNLLAHSLLSGNNHHKTIKTSHLIKTHGGGISKKPTSLASSSSSSRTTLALAVAMANTNTNTNKTKASILGDHIAGLKSRELGPSPLSPNVLGVHSIGGGGGGDDYKSPLSLRSFCHWRSFSLADLQQCQATVSSSLRSPDQVS